MYALERDDSTHRGGQCHAPRLGRVRRATALLVFAALCCLTAPVAVAGAASAAESAQASLAQIAVQQAELIAGDGADGDQFGLAVAISGDTALVGAPLNDFAVPTGGGAAYVFVRSGGSWTAQAKLRAADAAAFDRFGATVALDGETALVGAPWKGIAGKWSAGAAYIFERAGGSWTQRAALTASDGVVGDYFGTSVAIDGETALVGAIGDTVPPADPGAAYVFTRSSGFWLQQAKLTAADGAGNDGFGLSVALSGDTALVGARGHDTAGKTDAGAAYIFERAGGSWSQVAKPIATDGATGDAFGSSVALSGDTALVGAPDRAVGGNAFAGAAYVFTRSGGGWPQQATLTAGDGAAGDGFGASVAVLGQSAAVGAPYWDTSLSPNVGAAYVFSRAGSAWTQDARPTLEDGGAQDDFGYSVAISAGTVLVGAWGHSAAPHASTGAAYVITVAPPLPSITGVTPDSGAVGTPVTIVGSGFTGATAVTFNGVAAAFAVDSDMQITTTVPDGATSGPIAVTTPGGTARMRHFAVIVVPVIIKVTPSAARRGALVAISGSGFGARAEGSVRFGSHVCTSYVSWSDTLITCKVPKKAKFGRMRLTVTTNSSTSNIWRFTVKH
jgi:hypothetical protein